MFGYIEPLKPELKIKDYACFRSYYCGVCKALERGIIPLAGLPLPMMQLFWPCSILQLENMMKLYVLKSVL